MTGDRVCPYADMPAYITGAAPQLVSITVQALGDAFFEMRRQPQTPHSISAPLNHAILQMKRAESPAQVFAFAHAIQTGPLRDGVDLNAPAPYDAAGAEPDLPQLDTDGIGKSTERDPLVSESCARARKLEVRSFPTSIIPDDAGQAMGAVASVSEPVAFSEQDEAIVGANR